MARPWGHAEPDALLAEQVDSLFSFAPAAAFGSALGIIVMVMLFHSVAPPEWLWPWGALTLLLWSARAGQALLWHRLSISPQTDAELLRWRAGCYLMTLGSGALWGASTWLFFDHADPLSQAVLVIIIFSFCIAAVPILAHKPPVFYGYLALAFGPLVFRVAMSGQDRAAVLTGVLLLILGSMMVLGRSTRREFERGVALKQETQALLAQLREEKQAADAARQAAELANKAKTRFFAAASHDLRQPLHAMGLFAEALRGRVGPDPEVQRLAASINSAVDALEGLFSELMDITRIDSGGVQVRPEHVNVGELFQRLKLHFEPVAFDKGLSLHFRGGQHHVHADPVLLERVVRNLLSNAIRYTEDGGVLVAARRRGRQLRLEVWDSGRGIAPAEQQRIFEEFYQVGEAPGAVHGQGLGLGLAIVRRLAGLMDAPLVLRSAPGRGSLFMLSLPPGEASRSLPPVLPQAQGMLSLAQRLIVVVEDDTAVREGLLLLLGGWGASVVAFDSFRACQDWTRAVEPSMLTPDLLLADHRLEDGHTGLEVVQLMRNVFGAKVPAVLVTGTLGAELEAAARHQDCHLLLKPVLPHKLRAMLAAKLRRLA